MLQTIIIGIIPHRICTREAAVRHRNRNQPLRARKIATQREKDENAWCCERLQVVTYK